MAGLFLPSLGKAYLRGARSQMVNALAMTACALERYRLENQTYPKDLASLTPKFLNKIPLDVFSGAPLKYQPREDGTFVLYSVGLNGVDDGGTVVLRKGTTGVDSDQGDLVWKYVAER
jgi:Tfp pilus assembly protein PilE